MDSYLLWYPKHHGGKLFMGILDPDYIEAWPDFNTAALSFEGSPEFEGIKTVINVVEDANIKANAPTDGYKFISETNFPSGAEITDKSIEQMYDLLNKRWLSPKQKDLWEASGGNKIHVGDNISDINISSMSVKKGVVLTFGLILL